MEPPEMRQNSIRKQRKDYGLTYLGGMSVAPTTRGWGQCEFTPVDPLVPPTVVEAPKPQSSPQ